jgi:hypothetical protein
VPDLDDIAGLVAAADSKATTSTPAALSAWRPARDRTRARPCSSVAGALAGPSGWSATRAAAEPCASHPYGHRRDRVADAGRVQAWDCGSGLGTDDAAAPSCARVLAARCRSASTPTR